MRQKFLTLGIETSCDDTALAILDGERTVLSSVISSQIVDHAPFGGVVPELAARKHQEALIPLMRTLFAETGISPPDLSLMAVTAGPGLMGSLLVGVMSAKALAQAWQLPLVGVNHLEGHLFASVAANSDVAPPFLSLIVSGGHTEVVLVRAFGDYILLGATRDDAAGEAYDKAAKLLGLGYPGGPVIERMARAGDPSAFDFPIGMKSSDKVEFSFSGLKTALRTTVEKLSGENAAPLPMADLCASYQRAITDSLMLKLRIAVRETGVSSIAISGGVAANTALRDALLQAGETHKWRLHLPPKSYCTDNAVMIAAAGYAAYSRGVRSDLALTPNPAWSIWKED